MVTTLPAHVLVERSCLNCKDCERRKCSKQFICDDFSQDGKNRLVLDESGALYPIFSVLYAIFSVSVPLFFEGSYTVRGLPLRHIFGPYFCSMLPLFSTRFGGLA